MVTRSHIKRRILAPPRRRGFSLIEVIIVAAILSILSAIAFINSQRIMDDSRRKSVIAEAGEIAKAMTFARQDTGFFPKLNYLLEPLVSLVPGSGEGIVQNVATKTLYLDFDYIGRTITSSYNRRIYDTWVGRYFAVNPTGRSGQRAPSSFTRITLAQRGASDKRPWPVDQWGYPYVVYLLELTPEADVQKDGPVRFLTIPTQGPSYASAIVSYGEDALPGSLVTKSTSQTDPEYLRKVAQRLYRETGHLEYAMLDASDYTRLRVEGYSEQRFKTAPGYTWTGGYDLIGVIDPGSDDLIYEF